MQSALSSASSAWRSPKAPARRTSTVTMLTTQRPVSSSKTTSSPPSRMRIVLAALLELDLLLLMIAYPAKNYFISWTTPVYHRFGCPRSKRSTVNGRGAMATITTVNLRREYLTKLTAIKLTVLLKKLFHENIF